MYIKTIKFNIFIYLCVGVPKQIEKAILVSRGNLRYNVHPLFDLFEWWFLLVLVPPSGSYVASCLNLSSCAAWSKQCKYRL